MSSPANITTSLWIDYVVYMPSESVETASSTTSEVAAPTVMPPSPETTSSSRSISDMLPTVLTNTSSNVPSLAASQSTLPSPRSSLTSHPDRHIGVILGETAGALVAVLLIAVCLTTTLRRRRRSSQLQMRMVQTRNDLLSTLEPTLYRTNSFMSLHLEPVSLAQSALVLDTHNTIEGGRSAATTISSHNTPVSEKSDPGTELPTYDMIGKAAGDILLARGQFPGQRVIRDQMEQLEGGRWENGIQKMVRRGTLHPLHCCRSEETR